MIISHTVKDLREVISSLKKINKTISFVPTMGALHQGHISLVNLANESSDISVVSIFVNPTQFNEKSDLEKYPRTVEEDCKLLQKNQCDIVFIPSVEEVYCCDISCQADYGILTGVLEGAKRLGHFDGVVTVVKRLFEIVEPDVAFFGEKDFQQLAILREMTRRYDFNIEIKGAPIIREESGLAMSSRNRLLSKRDEEIALNLSSTLQWCVDHRANYELSFLLEKAKEMLSSNELLKLEYLEIVDSETFESLKSFESGKEARILVAAYVGKVRLIDNMAI